MHFILPVSVSKIHALVCDAFFYVTRIWIWSKTKLWKKDVCIVSVTIENISETICSGFLMVFLVPFDSFLSLSCVCLMWYIMKVSAC